MNNKEKIIIMKTKITSAIAVAAIALTMALKVNLNAKNNNLSDLSLANIEALARNEIFENREDRENPDKNCIYQCMDESSHSCEYWSNWPRQC